MNLMKLLTLIGLITFSFGFLLLILIKSGYAQIIPSESSEIGMLVMCYFPMMIGAFTVAVIQYLYGTEKFDRIK